MRVAGAPWPRHRPTPRHAPAPSAPGGRPTWILLAGTLLLPLLAGCAATGPEADVPRNARASFTWEPAQPRVGEAVRFQATVTSPVPGDAVAAVEWDVGGVRVSGTQATHAFAAPGTHTVSLTVRTQQAGTATARADVVVLAADAPAPTGSVDPTSTAAPRPSATPLATPQIHADVDGNIAAFSFTWAKDAASVAWDFGDGATSEETAPEHAYAARGTYEVRLTVAGGGARGEASLEVTIDRMPMQPHVVVGVPDSGINPYHETYYRPERTEHPCVYVQGFPCSVRELPLSVGQGLSYAAAVERDRALWDGLQADTWYWIPKTVFVAVSCEPTSSGYRVGTCVLDDPEAHGTGTTSSVVSQNPDALVAFREGGADIDPFRRAGLPVDVYSVSWGGRVFAPIITGDSAPLYVISSGNDARPNWADGWKGQARVINVGGGYAANRHEEPMAGKNPEVVSYYCRPVARPDAAEGVHEMCGTSFAAPTVAGALSKVILGVRRASGYTGTLEGGFVDPVAGLTVGGLRDAMNRTASYDPPVQYPVAYLGVPLNPAAPYVQWGWGFYDGLVADATLAHLLGEEAPERPPDVVAYMEAQHALKGAVNP